MVAKLETDICIVERWQKCMGYRFVPGGNYAQEIHICETFRYFLSYLQDQSFLRSRNHGNQDNVM